MTQFKAKSAGNRNNGNNSGWLIILAIAVFCCIPGRVQLWPFLVTGGIVLFICAAANIAVAMRKPPAAADKSDIPRLAVRLHEYDVMTPKMLRERGQELEREALNAALTSVKCPVCAAEPGVTCVPKQGIWHAKMSDTLFCHYMRMQKAVELGKADHDQVVAQCGGSLPKDVHL